MNINLKKKLIKLSDIGLLGIYYTLGAITIITVFNKIFKYIFDSENKKIKDIATPKLILQISFEAATIGIVAFILRQFIRSIPFPFDGTNGYNHYKTKEINGGVLIAFSVLTAFTDFKERINELIFRINMGYLNI